MVQWYSTATARPTRILTSDGFDGYLPTTLSAMTAARVQKTRHHHCCILHPRTHPLLRRQRLRVDAWQHHPGSSSDHPHHPPMPHSFHSQALRLCFSQSCRWRRGYAHPVPAWSLCPAPPPSSWLGAVCSAASSQLQALRFCVLSPQPASTGNQPCRCGSNFMHS